LVLKELSVYQSELQGIVVESTYNWYWLVDGLMEQGYQVHLANTAAIQQYNGPDAGVRQTLLIFSGLVPFSSCRTAFPDF